jgi:hypothetical protein
VPWAVSLLSCHSTDTLCRCICNVEPQTTVGTIEARLRKLKEVAREKAARIAELEAIITASGSKR